VRTRVWIAFSISSKVSLIASCTSLSASTSCVSARCIETDFGTLNVKSTAIRRFDTSRILTSPVSGSITGCPVSLSITGSCRTSFVLAVNRSLVFGTSL
jgi:hypothetical protein